MDRQAGWTRSFWEMQIVWSSTRILWDQQILLLWILLPPVFIVSLSIALAVPFLVRTNEVRDDDTKSFVPSGPLMTEKSR